MVNHNRPNALPKLAARFIFLASIGWLVYVGSGAIALVFHLPSTKPPVFTGTFREQALDLGPTGGLKDLVSADELKLAFRAIKPHWRVPKTNFILHALRFWGQEATFNDTYNPYGNGTPSGSRMLEVMLDSLEAERFQVGPYPFLYRTRFGVGVQYETGGGGIAHLDQYLKVMGELALRSDTMVRLPDGSRANLGDAIRDSLLHFDADQELEFTAVAYSRWLPPTRTWHNRNGEIHSFDEVSDLLLCKSPTKAACCGIHILYALVNILRVHAIHPIIKPELVARIERRLYETSRALEQNQDQSGVWLGRWYESRSPSPGEEWGFQAIAATGHHLEWIALAPDRLRPKREVIGRAAVALTRLINKHASVTISNSYPPFSHAGRALALMQETTPSMILDDRASEAGPTPHNRGLAE